MMTRTTVALLVLSLMSSGAWAQDDEIDIRTLPHYTAMGHGLYISAMDVSSRMELADDTRSKHYLSFDGFVVPAASEDVVAVSTGLRPLRIYDDAGNEMMPPPARGRTKDRPVEDFSAVETGRGETKLPKTVLIRAPWKVRSLDAEALLIVAKARQEYRAPAAVMEDYADASGVEVRIDRLTMSADRKLSVSVQFRRSGGGAVGPFVEAVYALDAEGNELGGGRWTEGSPMKDKGKLSFEFPLENAQFHSAFRIVICSVFDVTPVGFTITGLFD